MSTPVRVWFW